MAPPDSKIVTSPEPMEVQGVGDSNTIPAGGPGGSSGPSTGVVDLTQSDSGKELRGSSVDRGSRSPNIPV